MKTVPAKQLIRGDTSSCGCLYKEAAAVRNEMNVTHGHCRRNSKPTSEYNSWQAMKDRCHNPNSRSWEGWGARGIKVCERWRESFENFIADMGEKPKDGLRYSIDRINNDGNYEPGNCRWITYAEQMRNTSATVYIEHNGETLCITDWERRLGYAQNSLHNKVQKMRKAGLPLRLALLRPNEAATPEEMAAISGFLDQPEKSEQADSPRS